MCFITILNKHNWASLSTPDSIRLLYCSLYVLLVLYCIIITIHNGSWDKYKPDSKKVGTLYKLWIKTECNDVEVSNFNILFRIQHRWHIKCLNWENVSFYGKNKLILNFMATTHLKKVGTRPCLPLCGIPSSFYNSLQTSGDWGDKLLKFRNRNVVPFLSNTGF